MKPISNTAFYCCGIRMRDAQSAQPVCGDTFAQRFMDERGLEIFRRFGGEAGPNASNVARARYIDDLLRARLEAVPKLQIVLIGCGFDSRAYRLNGGTWFELDEPQLLSFKEACLPAALAPNQLQRVAIDFATDSLAERLARLDGAVPTVVVIEGVTMYVTAESLAATLATLTRLFARHEVVADLMTHRFINSYGRTVKRIISQLGADLIPGAQPAAPFAAAGYCEISRAEIAALSLRYRGAGWLVPVLRLLFPGLFSGYSVRVFAPRTDS